MSLSPDQIAAALFNLRDAAAVLRQGPAVDLADAADKLADWTARTYMPTSDAEVCDKCGLAGGDHCGRCALD